MKKKYNVRTRITMFFDVMVDGYDEEDVCGIVESMDTDEIMNSGNFVDEDVEAEYGDEVERED